MNNELIEIRNNRCKDLPQLHQVIYKVGFSDGHDASEGSGKE